MNGNITERVSYLMYFGGNVNTYSGIEKKKDFSMFIFRFSLNLASFDVCAV